MFLKKWEIQKKIGQLISNMDFFFRWFLRHFK